MNKLILILFISFCFFSASSQQQQQQYPGTNLRGQVVRIDPNYNTNTPLQNASVELQQWRWTGAYYQNGEQVWQWITIVSTYTDGSGIYYFYNIAMNNYQIKVNGSKSTPIQVVMIDYTQVQFQDMPMIYF